MSTNSERVVFITGCTDGGIGSALAKILATRGCTVYASTRSIKSMAGLEHPNIRKLVVDVVDDASVEAAVNEIYEKSGHLDIFISNAGLPGTAPILDMPFKHAESIMNTNFLGLVRLTNAIVPRMAKRRQGLVVAIGSILGELGTPFTGMYNASKAALHAYTEALSMECQPLGVNVMLVAPGSIVSNIANNASQVYEMPEDSLYKDYSKQITHVMFQSQMKEYGATPTMEFAKQVCDKVLAKSPPKYFCYGGSTWLWFWLKLLPRQTALSMLWKTLSKPPKA